MATAITANDVQETLFKELEPMSSDPSLISRDATFEDLDVDSLDLVELSQVIEDEFGVLLEGEDVKDLKTVGEAVDLVVARAS
jgi:acyl carrier protein